MTSTQNLDLSSLLEYLCFPERQCLDKSTFAATGIILELTQKFTILFRAVLLDSRKHESRDFHCILLFSLSTKLSFLLISQKTAISSDTFSCTLPYMVYVTQVFLSSSFLVFHLFSLHS